MSLAERAMSGKARNMTGRPCSIGELVAKLDGRELSGLNAMLYELGWSQERIFEELKDEGHIVGKQTINRHRSQACRCFQ